MMSDDDRAKVVKCLVDFIDKVTKKRTTFKGRSGSSARGRKSFKRIYYRSEFLTSK